MTILLITHSRDNDSILRVSQAIADQGGQVFRFDTDRFPTETQLEVYYSRGVERKMLIAPDQGAIDLNEVTAVWYRRVNIAAHLPQSLDSQLRHASILESRVTVQGMIASLNVFHLDPVSAIRRADNKQLQLQVARAVGLETPLTLTTNNPAAVLQFAEECDGMITKMLSSFAVYEEGKEKVVYTNLVQPEDLKQLTGLQFCPMTFQEAIPKAVELRVTIVGTQVFAAAVNSQKFDQSRYDWRRGALLKDWEPYTLPEEIKDKLLKLMARFNLHYGAIDIIVTPDNRYVFLEVNPVGEFFWLELCPGLPISRAIASLLVQNCTRPQNPQTTSNCSLGQASSHPLMQRLQ
jgi:MvdD family ATP-grasp ribosomal peptide maturase